MSIKDGFCATRSILSDTHAHTCLHTCLHTHIARALRERAYSAHQGVTKSKGSKLRTFEGKEYKGLREPLRTSVSFSPPKSPHPLRSLRREKASPPTKYGTRSLHPFSTRAQSGGWGVRRSAEKERRERAQGKNENERNRARAKLIQDISTSILSFSFSIASSLCLDLVWGTERGHAPPLWVMPSACFSVRD